MNLVLGAAVRPGLPPLTEIFELLFLLALVGGGLWYGLAWLRMSPDAQPIRRESATALVVTGGLVLAGLFAVTARLVLAAMSSGVIGVGVLVVPTAMGARSIGRFLEERYMRRQAARMTRALGVPVERHHWTLRVTLWAWGVPLFIGLPLAFFSWAFLLAASWGVPNGPGVQRMASFSALGGAIGAGLLLTAVGVCQYYRRIVSKRQYLHELRGKGMLAPDPQSVVPVWTAARRSVVSFPSALRDSWARLTPRERQPVLAVAAVILLMTVTVAASFVIGGGPILPPS